MSLPRRFDYERAIMEFLAIKDDFWSTGSVRTRLAIKSSLGFSFSSTWFSVTSISLSSSSACLILSSSYSSSSKSPSSRIYCSLMSIPSYSTYDSIFSSSRFLLLTLFLISLYMASVSLSFWFYSFWLFFYSYRVLSLLEAICLDCLSISSWRLSNWRPFYCVTKSW